ncbi:ABC transporter permease [Ramlibacter algicola]|uniref:ABC transporter permease n=1 Tax=Ramlibacter algicola TaxID=2795217 RepID=A0A934UT22_9BURK|nr:FtsX-like permease family protein [Ramlibacter algicola]MBK0394855.1 ABC transporter permease [Ramlibacter algicola]
MEIRPILSSLLRTRTAPLLVAIQVALSLAVLANALFIVHLRLQAADRPSGIAEEENVGYFGRTFADQMKHPQVLAEWERELAVLRGVPGVKAVTWGSQMPMSTSGSSSSVRVNEKQEQEVAVPSVYFVGPQFVPVLGLQVVEGRNLTDADMVDLDPETQGYFDDFPKNVVITRGLGEKLFPGEQSFVGKQFLFGKAAYVRIVGVLDRLQTTQAQHGAEGEYSVLLPRRVGQARVRYILRTEPGQRDKVMLAAEQALRKAAGEPVRLQVRSVSDDRQRRYRNERAMASMLIAVSGLLLLVTASGIVGLASLRVTQRRKQIGVRRALGARRIDILRYFLVENLMITSTGIVAGLFLGLALNALLETRLGLPKLPVTYLAGGALSLWVLGLLAVWGPAARAAGTSPAIATRTA